MATAATPFPLPKQDFHFFSYPPPPGPQPPIRLRTSSSWTWCGPLLQLPSPFPPSFHSWASHTFASPSSLSTTRLLPFLAWTHDLLRHAGFHHYWITIRASRPTAHFDTPRWHTDDNFFDPLAAPELATGLWKVCTTLEGPGTLFAADGHRARRLLRKVKDEARGRQPEHQCSFIACSTCGGMGDEVRREMAARMEDAGIKVVQSAAGEAVFFRIGAHEGSVHSEPPVGVDRVFVNIVPGRRDDFERLMARWGLEFPRSWSYGVPVVYEEEQVVAASQGVRNDGQQEEQSTAIIPPVEPTSMGNLDFR